MFEGLHIEIVALKVLGNLFDSSGWLGALVQTEVENPGTADSFLKASHVTCTCRTHQITACSLYVLLQKAYSKQGENDILLEDHWAYSPATSSYVQFWSIILQLELLEDLLAINMGGRLSTLCICFNKNGTFIFCPQSYQLC